MRISNIIQKNRSGISTLLVIVIVIIGVVAAAAVYMVVTSDKEVPDTLAPGTMLKYEVYVDGEEYGILEERIIGQNADEYFVSIKTKIGTQESESYTSVPKESPKDAKMTGVVEIETIDGMQKVEVWEYSTKVGGVTAKVKAYVGKTNEMPYRNETTIYGLTEVDELIEYELVWQKSYKESAAIGTTYEFVCKFEGLTIGAKLICVADCMGGQYGAAYDFTDFGGQIGYLLCDNPQGLPHESVNTGKTTTMTDTIDGDVSVEIWEVEDGGSTITYYCEPDTHVVYRFVLTLSTSELVFDLSKKP